MSRLKGYDGLSLLVFAASTISSPMVLAQDSPGQTDVGFAFRFMPTGRFEWSGRSSQSSSSLGAYPALGAASFIDYRLNRFASVGFMPEFTLNVIPRVTNYPVSAMIAGSLRVKVQSPGIGFLVPYILFAPGYSSLWGYGGSDGGNAHGFVLSGYAGARVPVGGRHSLFAEAGYMRGFQMDGGYDYAPSYLVLAAGWQASL